MLGFFRAWPVPLISCVSRGLNCSLRMVPSALMNSTLMMLLPASWMKRLMMSVLVWGLNMVGKQMGDSRLVREEYSQMLPKTSLVINRYKEKAPPQPRRRLRTFRNHHALKASDAHLCCATAWTGQPCKSAVGHVQNPVAVIGASVINPYLDDPAIGQIGHLHRGTKREVAMGGSHGISAEAFPIGSSLPMEAVSHAIPRGCATLTR